jgi:putative Holliday junction resolvase
VLGLDIGSRRVGAAISDPQGRVATPHDVLDAKSVEDARALLELIEDWEIGLVVIGLPTSLDGVEGEQAVRVRVCGDTLASRLPVPVVYQDERMSSAEAKRRMSEAGLSEKEQRGKVDMVAAALILQSYLDAHQSSIEGRAPRDDKEAGSDG